MALQLWRGHWTNKRCPVVQGWNDRGFIPARRQQEVLDAARRLGIDLTPADFFDLPSTPQDFLDQGGGEAA